MWTKERKHENSTKKLNYLLSIYILSTLFSKGQLSDRRLCGKTGILILKCKSGFWTRKKKKILSFKLKTVFAHHRRFEILQVSSKVIYHFTL